MLHLGITRLKTEYVLVKKLTASGKTVSGEIDLEHAAEWVLILTLCFLLSGYEFSLNIPVPIADLPFLN
jgi:hypothetical protein